MDLESLKKTPLFEVHQKYEGKIVDFGGWALPVQYSGIIDEHNAVRNNAGIFDVSHMGEVRIKGPEALDLVDYLLTNDVTSISDNQIQYSPMCYPDGGVVDDLLTYRFSENEFLMIPNAANKEKDLEWIEKHAADFDVSVVNESEDTGQIAIQGPKAEGVFNRVTDVNLGEIKFFRFKDNVDVDGITCLVSRTGYTGEDGFEIYCEAENTADVYESLMGAAEDDELVPAGLGARDTLRFEAGLCLYGQELGPDINPLEARLDFFVKLDRGDFIGKEALQKAKEEGLEKKLVGFEMIDRGVPRTNYPIFDQDEREVGHVSSGSHSPTLGKSVGMGFVEPNLAKEGIDLKIGVRSRKLDARTIKIPFYQ